MSPFVFHFPQTTVSTPIIPPSCEQPNPVCNLPSLPPAPPARIATPSRINNPHQPVLPLPSPRLASPRLPTHNANAHSPSHAAPRLPPLGNISQIAALFPSVRSGRLAAGKRAGMRVDVFGWLWLREPGRSFTNNEREGPWDWRGHSRGQMANGQAGADGRPALLVVGWKAVGAET